MELSRDEEQLLTLYRQCSPMQKMLITDAIEEMLALPGAIDLFSEAVREEEYDAVKEAPNCADAAGGAHMGKVLPFRRI